MKKALYPGTFDPTTRGHMDIATRAAGMCDELLVAVSEHTRKTQMFSIKERIAMAKAAFAHMPNVRVTSFRTLLVDFAQEHGIDVIIRGLRVTSDFEYEFSMCQFMKDQHPEMEQLYLMAGGSTLHISSTAVRELITLGAPLEKYVPAAVLKLIK